MSIVYQLTFFLALGLLAIVVTIFVFAVSLVGRATEAASKQQQDILLNQKEAKARQIEKIQGQIEEARKVGHLDESKLQDELQNTSDEIAGYNTDLKRLQEKIMLIRRKGAVVWPGAFLLATLVLTITASGLAELQNRAALPLWIISIGTLAFGIFRVFRTLGAIEEVTITSQEAIEKLPDAVKGALKELEDERKPILKLGFRGPQQPPFHIKVDSETKLEFFVGLRRGDVADNVTVNFYLCPGFSFPGIGSFTQDADNPTVPGFVTARVDLKPITPGVDIVDELVIKAPSKAGSFLCYCGVRCKGFQGELEKFEIIVE